VEQAAAAAESLQEQSDALAHAVSIFKLKIASPSAASTMIAPARAVNAPEEIEVVARPVKTAPSLPPAAPSRKPAPLARDDEFEEF
jgi:methyl-accepting chemotaxis protein